MYAAMKGAQPTTVHQSVQRTILEQIQDFRGNGRGTTSASKKRSPDAMGAEIDTGRRDGTLEGQVSRARPTKAMGLFDLEHFAHRLLIHTPFGMRSIR